MRKDRRECHTKTVLFSTSPAPNQDTNAGALRLKLQPEQHQSPSSNPARRRAIGAWSLKFLSLELGAWNLELSLRFIQENDLHPFARLGKAVEQTRCARRLCRVGQLRSRALRFKGGPQGALD